MSALHVSLFGHLTVEQDKLPMVDLPAKAQELFCYLLLHRDRGHTREALASLLWPDASCSLSPKYLRQTLWQLQSALDVRSAAGEPVADALILLNPGWIRINPQAPLWLDVALFEDAYRLVCDIPGPQLPYETARLVEEAVQLYRGDLLETWYQDWCLFERERLQLCYLALLDKLMSYCEGQRLYEKGVAYGHKILRYDRAREATYRRLMRLYFLAGDRTAALREYERCVAALTQELQLAPSQLTVTLYEQIRSDHLEEELPTLGSQLSTRHRYMLSPTMDVRQQIEQLQMALTTFHQQIQQDLVAIMNTLES